LSMDTAVTAASSRDLRATSDSTTATTRPPRKSAPLGRGPGLLLAKGLAELLFLLTGQVGGDELELHVLHPLRHSVQDRLARHQEERGRSFCHLAANLFDEIVVDAVVTERPSEGAKRRADGHAEEGSREDQSQQHTPKQSAHRTDAHQMDELLRPG